MGRTESTVIQVAPDYENDKIKEMEGFGWNLQGRQEVHQEGDAYGRPSLMSSRTYIVKVRVSHYVKLHFVRGLSLPNLPGIKQLEAEYNNLTFPALAPLGWPIGITAFFSIGVIGVMTGAFPVKFLPSYLIFVALGAFWIFRRLRKRQAATEQRAASLNRANQILSEVSRLTDAGGQAASAD